MRAPNLRSSEMRTSELELCFSSFSLLPVYFRSFRGTVGNMKTIEATATGTQLPAVTNVSLEILQFSTEQDRQMLIQAFEKGQNQGLVNALSRMRAVDRSPHAGL